MTTLDDALALASQDSYLAVVATTRADGTVAATVVNAGALIHPVTEERVVGLVAVGRATKLAHLRDRPRATVTFRAGWQWATIEGPTELIGPDDPHPDIDAETLRVLLRDVFIGAGGTHDDWDAYDRTMAEEGRTAVLITPERIYSNRAR